MCGNDGIMVGVWMDGHSYKMMECEWEWKFMVIKVIVWKTKFNIIHTCSVSKPFGQSFKNPLYLENWKAQLVK